MTELRKLIAQGEGEQLDFKFRIDDQKKIARTLAAFANTSGGKLLIGVKDNGKISGANPEEEFHMIEGAASVYCNPPVEFESKVWQEDHYLVLEIQVPMSENKHKALDDDKEWKFFHRLDDQTLLANRIVYLLWRYKRDGKQRPEVFNDETLSLIHLIRDEQPVTISKLYRKSTLNKNTVNELVATLIHWGLIDRLALNSGIAYKLSEE